jgi:predicted nuclease of restriction endonuclease-like (RecB) superfamily
MDSAHLLIRDITAIWTKARAQAFTLVNRAMIDAYWEIGRRIVLEEQNGQKKAQYGGFQLKALAEKLTREIDKNLDERELRRMRQLFFAFPTQDTLRPELTWSHYRLLLRIENDAARSYYLAEAADQTWSIRLLERNIQSNYYERIVANRTKAIPASPSTIQSSFSNNPHTDPAALSPADLIKDPFILEFLGLDMPAGFSESELESAILSNIHNFLLEMGKGFAFVARQYGIKTDTRQYYIDLVFYNYFLKAFVLAELKLGSLTHQDIGQMDMYVRMFEALKKIPGDNPTIGIILCAEKDDTLVKYSVMEENKHLFASRYKLVLPSEEELSREIEKGKLRYIDFNRE